MLLPLSVVIQALGIAQLKKNSQTPTNRRRKRLSCWLAPPTTHTRALPIMSELGKAVQLFRTGQCIHLLSINAIRPSSNLRAPMMSPMIIALLFP
jgi:hypothetical protein